MSVPQLISPLLDGFVMGDPISSHHGVRACPAVQLENDKKHIVKIISLPDSQSKLDALLLAGAFSDKESAAEYFKELADGVLEEASLLQKLARSEGFVAFENWQLIPMDNEETGFDVYLLGEYRPTLNSVLRGNEMTHLQAINLGLDLCAALSVCRRAGFMYSNLQPSNVFVCNEREFRIGDLGFLKLESLAFASLPDKYHSDYTPPEISDAYSALNTTMDTYAVGLILYQAYNDGRLPPVGMPAMAPCHADAALTEIILKACAMDPADRWQDPVQMGQALANYMQTNPVNDTPIAPPPPVEEIQEPEAVFPDLDTEPSTDDILAEVDDALEAAPPIITADTPDEICESAAVEAAEEIPAEEIEAEEAIVEEEEIEDAVEDTVVAVVLPEEELTEETPEVTEEPAETEAEEAKDEVSQILAQADELIAHQLPDPPVAPDPIEVTLPVVEEAPEEPAAVEEAEAETAAEPEEEGKEDAPVVPTEGNDAPARDDTGSRKRSNRPILIAIIVALILMLGAASVLYYQNFYLQTVEDMILTGTNDSLTVTIISDIDNGKLFVTCSDTHGNTRTARVENGIARFEGLSHGTDYTVEVGMDGLHKLQGDIKDTYRTDSTTVINGFYASTGLEDGSVILHFTPQGPDAEEWIITFTADAEAENSVTFTGHKATINGLTVGKEYTFKLAAKKDMPLAGTTEITYKVSKTVYAEDLKVLGISDKGLGVSWVTPDGCDVAKWFIHCYSEAGYDKTLSTPDNVIYFDVFDTATNYTIEVKAEGMNVGTRTYLTANAATLKDITVDDSDPSVLKVTWKSNGLLPDGGWVLTYSIDDNNSFKAISCEGNAGEISLIVPGAHYLITVKPADGSTVFGNTAEYDAPKADAFDAFLVTSENMEFSMCKTPSKADWDHKDVPSGDYTTSFTLGESAAFVAHLDKKTSKVDDMVTTLYVIHDHEGKLVSAKSETRTWDDMWDDRYGEYVIPTMPDDAGSYTVDIYFNGAFAFSQAFSIVARG